MPLELREIKPQSATPTYSDVVNNGPHITPQRHLQLYDAGEWEKFAEEYADGLKATTYASVLRTGGAGDKGIDIAAFKTADSFKGNWDNYQCKHYDHALHPGDILLEMGKLCYYTFIKEYSIPDNYYFVSPLGVGTSLAKLLRGQHEELKKLVIEKWKEKIESNITSVNKIVLEGDLAAYVNTFDFSIIKDITVLKLLEVHRTTPYYHHRFGGGLPARPLADTPPTEIAEIEVRYIQKLLAAYAEFLNIVDCKLEDVNTNDTLKRHLQKARIQFYSAESLHKFSRDYLNAGEYERLQDFIYDGIENIILSQHAHGFDRVKQAVQEAYRIQIDSHPLKERLNPIDRAGICHQLANNDRINWTKDGQEN